MTSDMEIAIFARLDRIVELLEEIAADKRDKPIPAYTPTFWAHKRCPVCGEQHPENGLPCPMLAPKAGGAA